MFGSHVLETAAGLAFIYFVLSTFASTVNEAISAVLSLRAKGLESALKNMLAQQAPQAAALEAAVGKVPPAPLPADANAVQAGWNLAKAVLEHPVVENLSAPKMFGKGISSPSYLDAKVFSSVLWDLLSPGQGGSLAQFRSAISSLKNQELRSTLLPLVDRAAGDIDKARANIEAWYDHAMDRMSGAYKRKAQLILFAIGLAFAAALNIDTPRVANILWTEPVVREQLVEQAKQTVKDNSAATAANSARSDSAAEYVGKYATLATPFGWSSKPSGWWNGLNPWTWPAHGDFWLALLGWFLTALAVSLGAPFWFDLLNNVLKLNTRLSGAQPAKSGTSGGK